MITLGPHLPLRLSLGAAPKMAEPKKGLHWDEQNLAANAEEAENAQRTKILEPKTPFHTLDEDGETPAAWPPKAPPARAAGPEDLQPGKQSQQSLVLPGMDLGALVNAAEERRAEAPEMDDVEKRAKFEEHRKAHYNVGGLAALRAKAAAMDEEEEEDD